MEQMELLTVDELKDRLEELQLPTTGSRAVLRERLRGAAEQIQDDSNNDKLTNKDVNAMKKTELVGRLRELSLLTTGKKEELRIRLKSALEIREDESTDEEEEEQQEIEDAQRENNNEVEGAGISVPRTTLSFKDVENALETFSGDGSKNFQRWLTNFEETAVLCGWTDVQRVIYAKRLLRGSAKLFANFECEAKSWSKLRKSLLEEFSTTLNSKEVHRQLNSVKKKQNELYQD